MRVHFATIPPEPLEDLRPFIDRFDSMMKVYRVCKEQREAALDLELIAQDHLRAAHDALPAEVVRLIPDLKGRDFHFDTGSGRISLTDA